MRSRWYFEFVIRIAVAGHMRMMVMVIVWAIVAGVHAAAVWRELLMRMLLVAGRCGGRRRRCGRCGGQMRRGRGRRGGDGCERRGITTGQVRNGTMLRVRRAVGSIVMMMMGQMQQRTCGSVLLMDAHMDACRQRCSSGCCVDGLCVRTVIICIKKPARNTRLPKRCS